MVGEQPAHLCQAGRIGDVAGDRICVEFLGDHLEIVAPGADKSHFVTVVAKALGYCASQIGVAAGDQHLHCHDLLVFTVEPRPWHFTSVYFFTRRVENIVPMVTHHRIVAWDLSMLWHQSAPMLLDSSNLTKLRAVAPSR
ncbi:hypothetical protein MSHO_40750 [Mycobacterium shottsii]|uniref:Uncharacterized protein n=1 Tax=Mycobacterium shottsii TaxID=133549 RepID=A0A7I7LGI2_9MYCO|nr:hypothetical protein MSHO_40750 [Mycobacterium shottsii]